MPRDRGDSREQIAYYRAQAPDYRRVDLSSGALAVPREKLLKLGPLPHILELAAGTGDWTRELVQIRRMVIAIDASPEMIEINRQRVTDPRVEYQQADRCDWAPQQQFDLTDRLCEAGFRRVAVYGDLEGNEHGPTRAAIVRGGVEIAPYGWTRGFSTRRGPPSRAWARRRQVRNWFDCDFHI